MEYLLIFLGGGLGSAARHGVNVMIARLWGSQFPIGTLCVNVLGSFIMGVVVAYWATRTGLPDRARLFLMTGVLGGFTTFSAFSLEVWMLTSRGELMSTCLYIAASLALGIGGLGAGMALVRWMT